MDKVVNYFHIPCLFSVEDTVLAVDSPETVQQLMSHAMQSFKERGIAHSKVVDPVITAHQESLLSYSCGIVRSKEDGAMVKKFRVTALIQETKNELKMCVIPLAKPARVDP